MPFRALSVGSRARGPVSRALPSAKMMTGAQTSDRAKLIQSGTMDGLGQDVARHVQFVPAPTADDDPFLIPRPFFLTPRPFARTSGESVFRAETPRT